MSRMRWTDELTEKLGLLIDAGLTAEQACRRLKTSRGSVLGRAWRKGWQFGKARPANPIQRELRRSPPPPPGPRKRRAGRPAIYTERLQFRVDPEMRERIRRVATANHTATHQTLRDLIEWGLEAGEQP